MTNNGQANGGTRPQMKKHPLADCENCSLQKRPYVPSKAPQGQATYAILGEAPGYQETLAREPFVGPSGKLVKEVLKRHEIDPNACFLTNVVACRPPDNIDPPKDAIAACKPRLMDELERSGAKRVLATGNFASRALLPTSDGILKVRVGPPRKIGSNGQKFEVVPTVHPAACLRSSDFFPYLVTDTGKLKAPASNWQPPKYKVADTEKSALRYLSLLENFGTLAVDIETSVEKDVAFDHPESAGILCVGIAYGPNKVIVFPSDVLQGEVGKALGERLVNSKLIAQNGKFDIPPLRFFHPDIKLYADTMLMHYALDERRGVHGLKVMAREYLGAPDYAARIKQFTTGRGANFSSIPSSILYEYNAYDCALTFQLYELFCRQLEDQGLSSLHDFLVRSSNALMEVESRGVHIDENYLEELDARYQTKLAALEEPLHKWVDNPRSPVQVRSALARLGVECSSTALPVLQNLQSWVASVQSNHPEAREVAALIDHLLEYRKVAKLHGTYIKGLRKRLHKGRVHTSYLLHGTTTGRLSSRNPNLQNQPRGPEVRRLFVPSHADNVFIKADFAQGEWRIVTILADEPYFAERFAEGRDVVADLQEELFGNRTDKEFRTLTKNIAYGSWYGMVLGRGDQGLYYAQHKLHMDPDEAYSYQRRLFELASNIPQWQERTRARVLAGETLTTYKGRRRHFWIITATNRHEVLNECLAYVPQSTLSDICLTGLCELEEMGYQVRLSTHDEIVIETTSSKAERVQFEMAGIMSEAAKEFSDKLPFPVETSIGSSWGAC